jgi:hypothetical protein
MLPRFKPDNFDENLELVEAVGQIAKRKGVTTVQAVIGWVSRQGAIPIPGSTKEARIIENCKPVSLTDKDMAEIQKILDTLPISGERYGGQHEAKAAASGFQMSGSSLISSLEKAMSVPAMRCSPSLKVKSCSARRCIDTLPASVLRTLG